MSEKTFIPLSVPNFSGNEKEYVNDAVVSEWVSTGGSLVPKFEQAIADYVGMPRAVACNSGTSGLHLAMMMAGIGAGDEVLAPTLTFIAAVNPIRYAGAQPVFLGCDDTLCLDPKLAEGYLTQNAEVKDGRCVSRVTGAGGMVVSNHDDWAEHAKHLSTQAKADELHFVHDEVGYNYRLTNLQAALGLAQLEQIEDFIREAARQIGSVDLQSPTLSTAERLDYAKNQVLSTVRKVAPYVLVGVGIGAAIHNFIPQAFVEQVLGSGQWYAVPLATLVGAPMYADIFGTIPIAESLYAKGAGLGTVLSFMMAVTALSLPSLVMLRKAVKPKLLAVFTGIVTVGIMGIGFLFNLVGPLFA